MVLCSLCPVFSQFYVGSLKCSWKYLSSQGSVLPGYSRCPTYFLQPYSIIPLFSISMELLYVPVLLYFQGDIYLYFHVPGSIQLCRVFPVIQDSHGFQYVTNFLSTFPMPKAHNVPTALYFHCCVTRALFPMPYVSSQFLENSPIFPWFKSQSLYIPMVL